MPTHIDNETNNLVRVKTMIRQEMEEAIEKAAPESNSDHYIYPFCYTP